MIDARIPLGYTGGFDAGQAIERAQTMKLRDTLMQQKQATHDLEAKKYEAEQAKTAAETQRDNAIRLAKLTTVANPENWGNVRQAAIALQVPPESLPEQFPGQDWLEQQRAILTMASDPKKMNAIQEKLALLNLTPGTPEYDKHARALIFESKVVPDAMGGVRIVPTDPTAYPQYQGGNQPPATLTDDDILKMEGGSGGNAGGTFQP